MSNTKNNINGNEQNSSEVVDKSAEFFKALLEGNHHLCSEITHTHLKNKMSIEELYEFIFKKHLYKIGELWEYNKLSVATEHLASSIVESLMNQLYVDLISKETKNKTVIATCVQNEFHQIGIKMICDIFEKNGWNTLFLGSNTPTSELLKMIQNKNPDVLAISMSLYFNLPELEKILQTTTELFPNLPILVGGQAFRLGGVEIIEKYPNVTYLPNIQSTDLFIKNFQ